MSVEENVLQKGVAAQGQLGGDADWWRSAVIYQVYPRSFKDASSDGVGDLPGLLEKLDYIAWLGADAIWLSPFFLSPMKDFGYDVSDYRQVDPLFGSMRDFDAVLERAHQLGVRILIDQVLSHTSDQHLWFKESRSSHDNPKADWYVWADPKADGSPPNNWLSIFGGSAWEWDSRRRQYYLHNFLASQPDLNFHNPEVQQALLEEVRFWLDKGVDGFRLDTVNMYVHDQQLRDNPPLAPGEKVNGVGENNPYSMQNPMYNITRPENLPFLEKLRALLDEYPAITTVGEVGAVTNMYKTVAEYTMGNKRLHMAYSFDFMTETFNAAHVHSVLQRMQEGIGDGWPCWAFTNHDVPRVVSRWNLSPEQAPLLMALMLSIRGTPCLYQGDELGLPEAEVPFEALQDPYGIRFWPDYKGRDGCRTPIPWEEDALYSGFSTHMPWLPVVQEHRGLSVEQQCADHDSVLQQVRNLIHWRRQQPALLQGGQQLWPVDGDLLVFERRVDGSEGQRIICVFNLGGQDAVFQSGLAGLKALEGYGFDSHCQADGQVSVPAYSAFFGQVAE